MLQQLLNISDQELRFQVNSRQSFEEFACLGVMNDIADATIGRWAPFIGQMRPLTTLTLGGRAHCLHSESINRQARSSSMCFSPQASFAASALLGSFGALGVFRVIWEDDPNRLPLAITPLLFALQQAIEGLVWLRSGLTTEVFASADAAPASVAYLFFAYCLWPVWMPLIALRWMGSNLLSRQRYWIQAALVVGSLFGLLLWLPLLQDPAVALPSLVHGSLRYSPPPLLPSDLGQKIGKGLYVILTIGPLLIPRGELRVFGGALLLAFIYTQLAYDFAFSSVWCYLSALLSLIIVWILHQNRPRSCLSIWLRARTSAQALNGSG